MAKTSGNGTRGSGSQGTIAQRAANGINTLIARAKLSERDFTEEEIKDLKRSAASAIRADKQGLDTTIIMAGIDGFVNRRAEVKPKLRLYRGISEAEAREMQNSSVAQLKETASICQDNMRKAEAASDRKWNGSTVSEWANHYSYARSLILYKERFKLK